MVSLWKDPEGKRVFSAHEAAMKITMLAESHSSTQVDQELDALRQKVKQLKDAVEQYKVKQYSIIQGLIQKFYEVGGCYN